jgi:uncharacterized protein
MNPERALTRYVDYSNNINLIARDITLPEGSFIKAIIGPRRSGKTSLMLLYMKNLQVKGNNKVFINCEDIDFAGITANDLSKIEEAIYRVYKPDEINQIFLFLDEIQVFPEWSKWVRTLFDQRKYNIFVTGSTSDLSLDKLPSELRGRAINTLVLPFSFKEYLKSKNITPKDYMKPDEISNIVSALQDFLNFGGYPEITKNPDLVLKRTMLSELYATVIQRDLIEKQSIRKQAIFKAFMNSLFGSACRNVSIPAMVNWFKSQGTEISEVTAIKYLNYAQSAFLFFLVYPYSKKIKERNTKPKLYVSDSGILGLFDSNKGKMLENTVYVQLIRQHQNIHYFKNKSADVDFVLTKENEVCKLTQVSYSINSPETYARETRSLWEASKQLNCNDLTIVTFDEEKTIEQDGSIIKVVPAWKWLLEQPQLKSENS